MRISQAISAAAALAAGIFITFSQAHDSTTALLGLLILSGGWVVAYFLLIAKSFGQPSTVQNLVVLIVAATIALLSIWATNQVALVAWILLMAWGAFTAVSQIPAIKATSAKSPERREHLITAGLGAALFFVQLIVHLTAVDPVTQVGFFGAYAVLLGVHQGISAASEKPKA